MLLPRRTAALALWAARERDPDHDVTPLAQEAAALFHELGTAVGLVMPEAAALAPSPTGPGILPPQERG